MVGVSKGERGRLSTVLRSRSLVGGATPELKEKLSQDALAVDSNCSKISDDKIPWFSLSPGTTTLEDNPAVSGISDRME